jgi:hypothetical protein
MKLKLISATILCLTVNSYAGLNGLTTTSRANCINNESVAWDATRKWDMVVFSKHCRGDDNECKWTDYPKYCEENKKECHVLDTGKDPVSTRRTGLVHWGEGVSGGWKVYGSFYIKHGDRWQLTSDRTRDCAKYDGWWDWKDPDDPDHPYHKNIDLSKLPEQNKGIQIIPANQMVDIDLTKYDKDYIESDSSYPKYLLSLRKTTTDVNNEFSISYTGLKSDEAHIKTTFTYKNVQIPQSQIIGYASTGTYIKDKGWTGISQYFSIDGVTCNYNVSDIKSQLGTIQLAKELVTYDVNNKPTTKYVEGRNDIGFTYNISWFDNMSHDLICANKNFDKTLLNKIIKYAILLDK